MTLHEFVWAWNNAVSCWVSKEWFDKVIPSPAAAQPILLQAVSSPTGYKPITGYSAEGAHGHETIRKVTDLRHISVRKQSYDG